MSKSIGNVTNPELITKGGEDLNKNPAYGVDTLRSTIGDQNIYLFNHN
jgi:isoleucyl-tRNA synthetase